MIFFDSILVFFIGICLGSFANVCIYRLPRNKQAITGRSFCPKCKKAIRIANKLVNGHGRMLVRKSGTEPKIRIMCESNNKSLILKCINIVKKTLN